MAPPGVVRQRGSRLKIELGVIAAVAALGATPFVIGNPYVLLILILANLYAVFAASWDLLAGYTGQFSFGQALGPASPRAPRRAGRPRHSLTR